MNNNSCQRESNMRSAECSRSDFLGLRHFFLAFKYSMQGLRDVALTSISFRHEIVLGTIHLLCVVLFARTGVERIVMFSLWGMLMAVEILNSAIEIVVNMVSPQKSEQARMAKDMGSAAVFVVATMIVIVWAYFILRTF